jgi:uncharacterized protein YacL
MLAEVIRLFITLAMAVSAAYLARHYRVAYVPKNFALILFIIIGTGLGYVIGGMTGRKLAALVWWINEKAKKLSSLELMGGVGGLVVGLIIASLIANPVEKSLKPIKEAAPYIIMTLYFVLGYIGFTLFINRQFNFDLNSNGKNVSAYSGENLLDTSAIIDGRIAGVIKTGFLQGSILVPRFVLAELQSIADSSNDLKRARGRRGLEVLEELQGQKEVKIIIIDDDVPSLSEVDDKLVKLSKEKQANLITNDYNLGKVAILEGVHVLNVNDLAANLRPVLLPSESLTIAIIKGGKEKDQGVGYLDDGTMVVIEGGRKSVGKTVTVSVSSVLQTSAGKLVFAKIK